MTTVTHVLAAVDLSDMSPTIIGYARRIADIWEARFTVIHVVHELAYHSGIFITDKPLDTLRHDLEMEACDRLAVLCADMCDSKASYDNLVVTGRPAVEIQQAIRERGVDYLVIGAHSNDKPEHQLFGSTTERLLLQILCPTVVVPSQRSVTFVSRG